jgi:ATP-dependent DNA ligase
MDGLRAGEVVRLKVKHIDSAQKIIQVEQSKGRKDRQCHAVARDARPVAPMVEGAPTCRLPRSPASRYSAGMRAHPVRTDGFVGPCIPTLAAKPPAGPDWVHEIKHDGYRLIVRRDGKAVRLFTRRGHDWTERYPAIAAAAGKLRAKSFTMDGETVVVGADGVAVFDALHRRHKATEAMLYAFDRWRGLAAHASQRPQSEAGEATGAEAAGHRFQRAHRPGRRHGVPARLQAGL